MIDTVVQGVSAKSARRKSDGQEFVLYEVQDSEGRVWTTTKKQLASEANRLVGRQVVIDGQIKQNGNFVNHYLEGITEGTNGSGNSMFTPPSGAVLPPLPSPAPTPTRTAPVPQNGNGDREASIHRQVAAKVSAHISADANQFWSNVDDLVTYFATGEKPNFLPTAKADINDKQFFTDEVMAKADEAQDFYQGHVDSDIPF